MKTTWIEVCKNTGLAIGVAASLLASAGFAQQTRAEMRLSADQREVEVGDKMNLTIEFKQAGTGNGVQVGTPQISTLEHFEIAGSSGGEMSMVGVGQNIVTTYKFTVELRAANPGTETLGPALLKYIDNQGQKQTIQSNTVSVTVIEKKGFSLFGKKKADDPQKNQPPANPPPAPPAGDDLGGLKPLEPESNMLIKLVYGLLLLGMVGGFVWRMMRKPSRTAAVPQVGKPAQLKDAWKKLGNEELSGKEFCLGLSNLVRECLQYRYLFAAVDYTTEEILKSLPQYKLSADEIQAVEKCLRTCDRVLYADANLTGRDNLRSLCSALLPKAQKN